MMTLTEITWQGPEWGEVTAFAATTDPIDDLLLHADVVSGLGQHARLWLAREGDVPVGAAFAFPLWPENPALGVRGRDAAVEAAMLEALVATGAWTHGYVICPPTQRPLFAALGRTNDDAPEVHMTLAVPPALPAGVRAGTLPEVDAFYRAQGAAAWNPLQFETGPYFVAEDEAGAIIAAAGTHFAYPALAQIGNVFTAPAARGQGLARACTAAVAHALFARGHGTVSLFVAVDNAPGRACYARLGFTNRRLLDCFAWDARPAGMS